MKIRLGASIGMAGALALAFSFGQATADSRRVVGSQVQRSEPISLASFELTVPLAPEGPLAPNDVQNGSAFTYQGQLKKNGVPVTGSCDAAFRLFDASSGGAQIGGTVTSATLQIVGGLFTIALDFGWIFTGEARWLETAVGCGEAQTTLSPRTALRPAPYAFALPGMRTVPGDNDLFDNPTMNVIGGEVSGMFSNTISADSFNSVIAGGQINIVDDASTYSAIGGGYVTIIESSPGSAISGGNANVIDNGSGSAIGGGYANVITSAVYAAIPGGRENRVEGNYGFAAGRRAKAMHDGAFVWGDSADSDVASTKTNQFVVRASNGVSLTLNAGDAKVTAFGERFRDNAIQAWAFIAADGTARSKYGIASIGHTTGIYTITMHSNAASNLTYAPVAIAEVDTPPTSAASARLTTVNVSGASTFVVYVTNGSYALVDNDITVIVTGR